MSLMIACAVNAGKSILALNEGNTMFSKFLSVLKDVALDVKNTFMDLDLSVKALLVLGIVCSPVIMISAIALLVVVGVVRNLKGE